MRKLLTLLTAGLLTPAPGPGHPPRDRDIRDAEPSVRRAGTPHRGPLLPHPLGDHQPDDGRADRDGVAHQPFQGAGLRDVHSGSGRRSTRAPREPAPQARMGQPMAVFRSQRTPSTSSAGRPGGEVHHGSHACQPEPASSGTSPTSTVPAPAAAVRARAETAASHGHPRRPQREPGRPAGRPRTAARTQQHRAHQHAECPGPQTRRSSAVQPANTPRGRRRPRSSRRQGR